MTLPNFLIIGAAKAGTTSLYDHFRSHPQIYMPSLKEARFFGYEGGGDRRKFPIQSQEEYEALFADVQDEIAIGEATPHYMVYPNAAKRIHALIPQAKLIASLRDPVDRSHSVYQMNLRNRGVNEGVSYIEALQKDHNLRETYFEKLQRYVDLFPRAQLRIILLDDLKAKPARTVRNLFDFLGVDPGFEPDLARVSNPGGTPRIKVLHDLMNHPAIRGFGRQILPAGLLERAKDLRSRNLKQEGLSQEDRAAAITLFREDIERTQDLIGVDLTRWLEA